MNNLKERIAKAFGKYDVVVVSGSQGVGKTSLLKDFVKENGVWVCVADITYIALKHKIKENNLVAIDDVNRSELKTLVKKVQEIIAKTNNKPKILIATDYFDKDSIDSAMLKVKHLRLRKEKKASKKSHADLFLETLRHYAQKPYVSDVEFLYSLNDIEKEKLKTRCYNKTLEDMERELEQAYAKLDIADYEIQELHALVSHHEDKIKKLHDNNLEKDCVIEKNKYAIDKLEIKLEEACVDNDAITLRFEKVVSSLKEEYELLEREKKQLIKENNHLGNVIRSMKLS